MAFKRKFFVAFNGAEYRRFTVVQQFSSLLLHQTLAGNSTEEKPAGEMTSDNESKLQAEAEREATRLWRAWRTVKEMCLDRVGKPQKPPSTTFHQRISMESVVTSLYLAC
jgi:RNA polymerase Rpb5, N-terminal domain